MNLSTDLKNVFFNTGTERESSERMIDGIKHSQRLQASKLGKTNEEVFQLNSIIKYSYTDAEKVNRIESNKKSYEYDTDGNTTLELTYEWNSGSNDWVNYKKEESTYDVNGNKILFADYNWSSIENIWEGSNKDESVYNENGGQTLNTYYIWDDESNNWIAEGKSEFFYLANGNLTLIQSYNWNGTSNDWDKNMKVTFDAKGTVEFLYIWDSSNWLLFAKGDNKYNTNDKLTSQVVTVLDEDTNEWVKENKTEYTYYTTQKLKEEILYDWDTNSIDWDAVQKNNYEYDINGNETLFLTTDKDETNVWMGTYKREHDYGGGNVLLSYAESYIDGNFHDWGSDSYKEEYTYENGNKSSIVNYKLDGIPANWKLSSKQEYKFDSDNKITSMDDFLYLASDWDKYATSEYNYTKIELSNSINELIGLKVYPNPTAGNYIVINAPENNFEYKLFTSNGVLVLEGSTDISSRKLDVSRLNNGVYILQVIQGEKIAFKKIIK